MNLNNNDLKNAYNGFRREYENQFKSPNRDFNDLFPEKNYQVTTILKAQESQNSSIKSYHVAIWEVRNGIVEPPKNEEGQVF